MASDYGIKASPDQLDALTIEDTSLVTTSKNNNLKSRTVVADTITTNGSGVATKVINHGLGFAPVMFLAISFNDALYFEPFNGAGSPDLWIYCTVSDENITVILSALSNPSEVFDIYYWLSESEEV